MREPESNASEIDRAWGESGALAFPIDVRAVLAHMRQDMRDDWFLDALNHQDLFAQPDDLKRVLCALLLEGNGKYPGTERVLYDIPKRGLGVRYSLETDFYDRFLYQAICTFLIPFFDPLLSPRVLGHRYNKRRTREKYLFKSRMDLWQTFEGVTYTALRNKKALLVTDLINYFENISIDQIRKSFESLIPRINASGPVKLQIRNAIQTLCELLVRWSYSERHGLPQNRDPSSFVANIILCEVDHRIAKAGFDYFRYVDDIRILCADEKAAKRALVSLVAELRTVGMNINSAKTNILTVETTEATVAEFFPSTDDRITAIDNMWRSRSRRIVARSATYLFSLLKQCIERKETQTKQFRFAVNRLIQLVDANLFDLQSSIAADLVALLIDTLDEQPVSADQYCKLFKALPLTDSHYAQIQEFLADPNRSIHPWQKYHLWRMLAQKKYKSASLLSVAQSALNTDLLSPDSAAIFIYLRCVDEHQLLIPLVEQFDASWPYYHQRHFLLATSALDPGLLRPIVGHLGVRLQGTARRAAPHFDQDSHPVAKSEQLQLTRLYDELSPYD